MQNTNATANEFITHEVFEAYIKNINSRIETDEKLDDLRMKRIEAIIDKNMADINKAIGLLSENTAHAFNLINEKLNNTNERISHVEKLFDEKIEHVTDTLTVAINNIDGRITDMHNNLKHEQNKTLAKWGIAVALFVGTVQVAVSIVLNFWK